MKKSFLKKIIKEVISEIVTESAPPNFPPALEKKLLTKYKHDPSKAYATMWSIQNKKNEGDKKVNEMWTAWEGKNSQTEEYDPDDEERREWDSKINRYNDSHKNRFPCPTCKTPDALSAWEKKQGYQCTSCADSEEGVFEQSNTKLNQIVRDTMDEWVHGKRWKQNAAGDSILSIGGLDDIEISVEYEADVNHGVQSNDPQEHEGTELELTSLTAGEDLKVSELDPPSEEDWKFIKAYQDAVKKLVPNVSDDIIIPKGIDLLELNKITGGLLEDGINSLYETLTEKHYKDEPDYDGFDDDGFDDDAEF